MSIEVVDIQQDEIKEDANNNQTVENQIENTIGKPIDFC
jgi:hypothetical protein